MAHEKAFGKYVCKCDRAKCGHVWLSAELPMRCGKCKSPYWQARVAVRTGKHDDEFSGPPAQGPQKVVEKPVANRVEAVKEAVVAPPFAVDPEPYMTPTGTVKRSDEVERRSFLKVAAAPKAKWKKGAK